MSKTINIGKNTLGSGGKMEINLHNYDSSTSDKGYTFKTTVNKNSLIDIEVLEDTPFGTVTIEGRSFGVIGQNRITEEYDDIEKLKEDLKKID